MATKKTAKKSAKKALAKTNPNTFVDDRPDYVNEDSSRGQEGVGVEDLTIPRLGLIQDLSPQRKKNAPEYIPGAEEGLLFNTVTNELYGNEVNFVPVYFRKEWLIWKNQEDGGGFAGAYGNEAEARAEFERQGFDEEVYEVVDTSQHFGMIVRGDGSLEDIVVSMSKSKNKISRQFNTLVKMSGGDRFSRAYRIGAAEAENDKGQKFQNFSIHQLGYVSEEIYRAGEKMYEAISSGIKDVNRGTPVSDEEETEY